MNPCCALVEHPSIRRAGRLYPWRVASSKQQGIADQRREKLKKVRLEQRRRERTRRILLFGGVGAGIAIAAFIVVVVLGTHSQAGEIASTSGAAGTQIIPSAPTGATTVQSTVTPVPDKSGIPGVLAWDTTGWPGGGSPRAGALEHQHVAGPVTYIITPPVGGPHDGIWMNAGVYTKPVPAERAVHDMEHGAVWLTYNPNLPASEISTLTAFVAKQSLIAETGESAAGIAAGNSNRYVDLSPWETNSLPSPIVISAWGHQLRLTSASDPRMQKFVDMFRHSAVFSPEYGSAVDGIPIQTGGRPATGGSTRPNPEGVAG